jgi:diguanylate cyclase (GGDEF)-like protein
MNLFEKFIEKLYLRIPYNLAYFDVLTGVHNRNYFENVIKNKYKDQEIDFILIDLDNLKAVNDIRGHLSGDIAIKKIATILKENRPLEVARLGGDEFVGIYKPGSFNIDKLKAECGNIDDYDFSYGLAKKSKTTSIEEAFQIADVELYKLKKEKKTTK